MHLASQDSSSHAILRLPYDCQTRPQQLSLSSPSHLCAIFCNKIDDVVEIVSADVQLPLRVVLEAGWTAEVYSTTNGSTVRLFGGGAVFPYIRLSMRLPDLPCFLFSDPPTARLSEGPLVRSSVRPFVLPYVGPHVRSDCSTNDKFPSIVTHLSDEFFRRHCFAQESFSIGNCG